MRAPAARGARAPLRAPARARPRPPRTARANATPPSAPPRFDAVALGNICVDVFVGVPSIPPPAVVKTAATLATLQAAAADPASGSRLELGGATNFLIAAARLGLATAAVAHVGDDTEGWFALDALAAEGVARVERVADARGDVGARGTLLCYVLTHAPSAGHAFCSEYDLGPHPLLAPGVGDGLEGGSDDSRAARSAGATTPPPRPVTLPPPALDVLTGASCIFVNGFAYDELPAGALLAALAAARAAGASILFDPGPRSPALAARGVLGPALDVADVVLATEEEAEAVTGVVGAAAAAAALLARPGAPTSVVIVKQGADGALMVRRGADGALASTSRRAPSVAVADTVGCGDSFAAAIALAMRERAAPGPTLALANAVGAATATRHGAGRAVADAAAVRGLLAADAGTGDADAMAALALLDTATSAAAAKAAAEEGAAAAA